MPTLAIPTPKTDIFRRNFLDFIVRLNPQQVVSDPLAQRATAITNLRAVGLELPDLKTSILRPAILDVADLLETGHDDCIHWQGARYGNGYGLVSPSPTRSWSKTSAHKRVFEIAVDIKIPMGFQADHLCHDPNDCVDRSTCLHILCINPMHIGIASRRVNILRSGGLGAVNAAKTHCPAGHAYDKQNTKILVGSTGTPRRDCRTCANARSRARRAVAALVLPHAA